MPMETDINTVTGRNTEGLNNGNIIAIFFGILGAVFFIITLTVGGGLCRKRILSWLEKRRNSDQADAVPENQSPNHPVELITNRSEGAAELLLHQSPAQIEPRTMSAAAHESETNVSAQSPNPAVLNAPSEEAGGSAGGNQSSLNHQADSSSELSEGAPGVRDEADVAGGSDNASAAFSGNTDLTDIFFMNLAQKIGSEWKDLATILRIETSEIDHIIEDERHTKYRIQRILICWRQRIKNDTKKVEVLCKALTKCNRRDLSEQVKSGAIESY